MPPSAPPSRFLRPLLFTLLPAIAACAPGASPADMAPAPLPVDETCTWKAAPWAPGTPVFRDASDDWGLTAMGALAVRVSVLDIDADGWPDLLLRAGGGPDEFTADPPKRSRYLLRNEDGKRFVDVTRSSGLLRGRLDGSPARGREAELMAAADVDNDGDVDVFMARNVTDPEEPQETCEVMLNNGDGTFVLGPEDSAARSAMEPIMPVGAAFGDVDLDGLVDLFISNNMLPGDQSPLQDRLLRNVGGGRFQDATDALGLTTEWWGDPEVLDAGNGNSWGWGAAICDLNNDGLLEILSSSYGRAPNHLWQAVADGGKLARFANRSVASGYAYDHRQDWTTNVNAQCYCADNPKAPDCGTAPPPPSTDLCARLKAGFGGSYRWNHAGDRRPWRLGGNSATTTCADVNNDGFLDLMTGEIVHWDVGPTSDPAELMFNTGEGDVKFTRPGNETTGLLRERKGSSWDDGDMNNAVFDFDNDGRLDVYISSSDYPGTRGWLFHQVAKERFERVPTADGVDHLRSAGAIAVDLDRDGDLDLVVGHARFRCGGNFGNDCYATQKVRVFENLTNGRNHWLELRLEGANGSNRGAVGARVEVRTCDLPQTRQVEGGHGIVGTQEDAVLHFGLGAQARARVIVHWPDAAHTVEEAIVEADAVYHVTQGRPPSPLTIKR